jgi:hypothetical protein
MADPFLKWHQQSSFHETVEINALDIAATFNIAVTIS